MAHFDHIQRLNGGRWTPRWTLFHSTNHCPLTNPEVLHAPAGGRRAAPLRLRVRLGQLYNGAINHTPPPCAPNNCDNWTWPMQHGKEMSDWQHATTSATAGMAVVGCIVIAIGALCALILFRLLAFVEPGTASGAALRQSWSDAGGMAGIMRGGGQESSGSSAARASSSDGRAAGGASGDRGRQKGTHLGGGGSGIDRRDRRHAEWS